jgi:hypothetical protein
MTGNGEALGRVLIKSGSVDNKSNTLAERF